MDGWPNRARHIQSIPQSLDDGLLDPIAGSVC
jgi:hypothetical protein